MKHTYTRTFEMKHFYAGKDLGSTYKKEKTIFKVWAPTAKQVEVKLYQSGDGETLLRTEPMKRGKKGVWELTLEGDMAGVYYTYLVTVDGVTREAVDPYAKAVGVNGERSMVVDLDATNPDGFAKEQRPRQIPITDAVIYEAHVRDLTMDAASGVRNKGKYLGVAENGTKNTYGQSTGIDYMKELGITHVQLLPVYDFATVDERNTQADEYNWGYDPMNYNVPEGSYSTDPFHGEVRIREFKSMVQAFHANGIRVVMDVVYNHAFDADVFCFQKIVPDYFFRKNEQGYSNGSACGNETASEHWMVRKYIIDSVCYWAKEYHVDGFRFDLMGILDTATMRALRVALNKIDPNILLYGEGWTGDVCALPEKKRYMKVHTSQIKGIAAFNDDIRDAIKGSVFEHEDKGFVNGEPGMEHGIRFGVVGAIRHPQVNFKNESCAWAGDPSQSINYVSCHDNYTLWDKLHESRKDASFETRLAMNKLTAAIIFTAQGVPLMQAGEEILRSKPLAGQDGSFSENSYNLSDYTNCIRWDSVKEYHTVHDYYQGLIAFRKAHGALRMQTAEEVRKHLTFWDVQEKNVVAYTIEHHPNGEAADKLFIIYNANEGDVEVALPDKDCWNVCINHEKAGTDVIEKVQGKVRIFGISAMVLIK